MMKFPNKYIAFWTIIWLQFYFFFSELHQIALAGQSLPKQLMMIGMAIYCIHFIIYFFMLMNRRISAHIQKSHETFFAVFSLLLSVTMLIYMWNNDWLWTEANIGQIILELGQFVLMVVASLVVNFFHFIKKETIDLDDRTLWSTFDTYDTVFWGALVITSFLLGLWTSKLPIANRNYYELLRIILVDVILLAAMNKNRLFLNQRKLFYAVLLGYFVACTYQSLTVLFIFNPSLGSELTALGDKSNYVIISGVLSIVHWLVLASWVTWDLLAENAQIKSKR